MVAGKDSVGTAVPFVIGAACASYSLKIFYVNSGELAALSVLSISAAVISGLLLWKSRHRGLLYFLAMSGGAAAVLISGQSYAASSSGAAGVIGGWSYAFRDFIDSLPFPDGRCNALVKAFLTGDQSDIGLKTRNAFRESGASHLLALSGMHLSLIYLVISRLLSVMGNTPAVRVTRSVLIIIVSAFYTILTGAAPSLTRAFYFILLRECSLLTGRCPENMDILCSALLVQVAICPHTVTSVGFQLSYLAMTGIYLMYRPIDSLWEKSFRNRDRHRETDTEKKTVTEYRFQYICISLRKIWSMCSLSVSCQIATAPAVLLYFGTFPQYFLITNLLCIPLSNIIIVLSLFALPLHSAGICPGILLNTVNQLADCMIWILETIASL